MDWVDLKVKSDGRKLRYLRPVPTPSHERLQEAVVRALRASLYLPLVRTLKASPGAVLNAKGALYTALSAGRLAYQDGAFRGEFDADTSRELRDLGAEWRDGAWHLRVDSMPPELHQAIRESRTAIQKQGAALDEQLAKLDVTKLVDSIDLTAAYEAVADKVETGLSASLRIVSVEPAMSPAAREKLSEEYTENMRRYVADFAREEIAKLREQVEENVLAGHRREQLVKTIQASYDVSKRKAQFLARQETSLFTAKLKEARYAEAGIDEYKWRCVAGSPLHPVRPMHRALSERSDRGETFRFSNPPITDDKGSRNNPGEDFNCRCHAIPVVRF